MFSFSLWKKGVVNGEKVISKEVEKGKAYLFAVVHRKDVRDTVLYKYVVNNASIEGRDVDLYTGLYLLVGNGKEAKIVLKGTGPFAIYYAEGEPWVGEIDNRVYLGHRVKRGRIVMGAVYCDRPVEKSMVIYDPEGYRIDKIEEEAGRPLAFSYPAAVSGKYKYRIWVEDEAECSVVALEANVGELLEFMESGEVF